MYVENLTVFRLLDVASSFDKIQGIRKKVSDHNDTSQRIQNVGHVKDNWSGLIKKWMTSVKKIYVLKVGETVVYENRQDSNQIQCVNIDRTFGSKNNIKKKPTLFRSTWGRIVNFLRCDNGIMGMWENVLILRWCMWNREKVTMPACYF